VRLKKCWVLALNGDTFRVLRFPCRRDGREMERRCKPIRRRSPKIGGNSGRALPAGVAPPGPKKSKENTMATKRPSFLKRQKEQKRNERALEKREARRGRKEFRGVENAIPEGPDRV
jgi:hypothetical protein